MTRWNEALADALLYTGADVLGLRRNVKWLRPWLAWGECRRFDAMSNIERTADGREWQIIDADG